MQRWGATLQGLSCLGSRRGANPGTPRPQDICRKEHCRNRCLPGRAPCSTHHPPHGSYEGHDIPMAEALPALNHLLFVIQWWWCEVTRRITAMITQSHIFSTSSAFFAFVPVPSPKVRCLTMRLPDGLGTVLPAQAVSETTHGTYEGLPSSPTLERNSRLSAGVLRPRTGQHMPRERGCAGCSREAGVQPERGPLLEQFGVSRATLCQGFLAESTFFHLYRHFGEGAENKGFGYVVGDAGRMTPGMRGSPIWCPQYLSAQQQWDLACRVTGTNEWLDVLASFPTEKRPVSLRCLSICPWQRVALPATITQP